MLKSFNSFSSTLWVSYMNVWAFSFLTSYFTKVSLLVHGIYFSPNRHCSTKLDGWGMNNLGKQTDFKSDYDIKSILCYLDGTWRNEHTSIGFVVKPMQKWYRIIGFVQQDNIWQGFVLLWWQLTAEMNPLIMCLHSVNRDDLSMWETPFQNIWWKNLINKLW